MKPKLRTALIIIGVVTIVIIVVVLVPRLSSVYFQIRGSQRVEYVQRFELGLQELVCEPLSPINEEARNEVERGIGDLDRSITLNNKNSQAYYYLGKANCLLGDVDNAIGYYSRYTEIRPQNPMGYIGLGFAYEKLGERSLAKDSWLKAGLTPHDFVRSGMENYKQGKITEALSWLLRAAVMGEEVDSSVNYFRYLLALQTDAQKESQAILEKAIYENNGWINNEVEFFAWYSMGKLLFELNQMENAEDALIYSINIEPKNGVPSYDLSEAYRYLGLSQWSQQKYDLAKKNLEISIKTNNNNPWAHIHYAKLLWIIDQNLLSEIRGELYYALQIAPNNLTVWESVINFWNVNNFFENVIELCERAEKQGLILADIPSCGGINIK